MAAAPDSSELALLATKQWMESKLTDVHLGGLVWEYVCDDMLASEKCSLKLVNYEEKIREKKLRPRFATSDREGQMYTYNYHDGYYQGDTVFTCQLHESGAKTCRIVHTHKGREPISVTSSSSTTVLDNHLATRVVEVNTVASNGVWIEFQYEDNAQRLVCISDPKLPVVYLKAESLPQWPGAISSCGKQYVKTTIGCFFGSGQAPLLVYNGIDNEKHRRDYKTALPFETRLPAAGGVQYPARLIFPCVTPRHYIILEECVAYWVLSLLHVPVESETYDILWSHVVEEMGTTDEPCDLWVSGEQIKLLFRRDHVTPQHKEVHCLTFAARE